MARFRRKAFAGAERKLCFVCNSIPPSSTWPDCDPNNSHWFKNKQDQNTWVGVRYGWAKVNFHSTKGRNSFLQDEDKHFVRQSDDESWEKLKVSPWFDKPKQRPVFSKSERSPRPVPLYKADLPLAGQYDTDEFSRGCRDLSIQAYRATVHSYLPRQRGQQGQLGYLEVSLLTLQGLQPELVVFHTDSVCQGPGASQGRLKVSTPVSFTARRLPQGLVEAVRFQAKTIWEGQDSRPNWVTAPSAQRLDSWLQPLLAGSSRSATSSPDTSETRSIELPADSATDSGQNSPLPR